MTRFQNVSGKEITIFEKDATVVNATLKNLAILEGRRIDEYTIYTNDFGMVETRDRFTHSVSLKEVQTSLDSVWRVRVQQKTVALPGPFTIPSGEIVIVLERVRTLGQDEDWYLLWYNGEYASIPVSSCESEFLPIYRPLMIRVLHPEGIFLQREKEPLSEKVAHAPMESILLVEYKTFSSIPSQFQLPRWRLWRNKGWITYDPLRVEIIGCATPSIERKFLRFIENLCPSSPTTLTPDAIKGTCCICMEKPVEIAFVHEEHAHVACCHACAPRWCKDNDSCPICRLPTKTTVRVFYS